jgi:hypothetical protein
MANYSTDDDLLEIRRDILSLGISDWDLQHEQAKTFIDRDLETRWYRKEALNRGVDYNTDRYSNLLLLDTTQLTRLSCYKVLELAFLFIGHEYEADPSAKKSDMFAKLYNDEFDRVIDFGLQYDWDEDSSLDDYEDLRGSARTLTRI